MQLIPASALGERAYLALDVVQYSPRGVSVPGNVIVFRHAGHIYAYRNLCMHMRQPLDGQVKAIFDAEGRWLRCSMHGFLFEPDTGECISPVCAGQSLPQIKIVEEAGWIALKEKNMQVLRIHQHANACAAEVV